MNLFNRSLTLLNRLAVRPVLRPVVAITVSSLLMACLLSFHPLDSSPFNLYTSLGGIQNRFGILGALLAGALVEAFGGASLLLPFLIFSRICLPNRQISALRYWMTALLTLFSFAFLLGMLDVPPNSSLKGSGWVGWSSLNWTQQTLGSKLGLIFAIISFSWLILQLKPRGLAFVPKKLLHTMNIVLEAVTSFSSFLIVPKRFNPFQKHPCPPLRYRQSARPEIPPSNSAIPSRPLPHPLSTEPQTAPQAITPAPDEPSSSPPSPPSSPPSPFKKDWEQRCKVWQDNLELDWIRSSDHSKSD